jgi:hypothetical protein
MKLRNLAVDTTFGLYNYYTNACRSDKNLMSRDTNKKAPGKPKSSF